MTPPLAPFPPSNIPSDSGSVLNTRPDSKPEKDPILENLRGPVGRLVQDDVRLAIDPEKIYRYAQLRRNELYWRGNQYLDEIYNQDGQLVDYKPIDGTWHEFVDDDSDGTYYTVVNDLRGYGRKFIAVLAQGPPNVKAEPNDETNDDHVRRAKLAQDIADKLHNLWKVKRDNQKLFLTFYKNGPAFGYTRFVADGEKYGYVEEPVMKDTPVPVGSPTMQCKFCGTSTSVEDINVLPEMCPTCGEPLSQEDFREPEVMTLPQQVGVKRYANGCVEHTVESEMRITTEFDIQSLVDTNWLMRERELHKGRIFRQYPQYRDKFRNEGQDAYGGGGTSTTAGQITREIASSPSGIYLAPRKNTLMFTEVWLRPTMYELCQGDVEINGQTMKTRDALRKLYPTGMQVNLISGDYIAEIKEARLDDFFCMAQPEPAETAYADPVCTDFVDVQDLINDLANIQRQTWERAIPQVLIDTRRIDTTFQHRYRQLPASFIPIQSGQGGNINDAIGHVPVAKPEPEMQQYSDGQREIGAGIIGITPQIYGAGTAETTAYATNLKRNQAMLQLSMAADSARDYWCGVTYNAVILMAKYSGGRIPSPFSPQQEVDIVDGIEELLQGGFHFEGADAIPMSWPEQREQLNENLKNLAGNPQMLTQLGYNLPSNIPALQDKIIGMPNWEIPNQEALSKVKNEIRQLLQAQPTQQPSQMAPGQTVDIPSIPVDEYDPHDFVAAALEEWFQTEKAQGIRQSNPNGYANVVAFWKSHKGLSLPPPPPMGAPPGPGGPTPPGPPGPPGVAPPALAAPPGPPKPGGPPAPAPNGLVSKPPVLMPPVGGQAAQGPPK
jgi:hypothetical protein